MVERGAKRFQARQETRSRQIRAMRESVPIKDLKQIHQLKDLQDNAYEKIAASDYYYYTNNRSPLIPHEVLQLDVEKVKELGMNPSDLHWEQVPLLYFTLLYSSSKPLADKTYNNYITLKKDYSDITAYTPPDELPYVARNLLHRSYYLVHNLTELDAVPPSLRKHHNLKGNQQIVLRQAIEKIGTEKSESFREMMRRFIPRWMHQPIPYPEGEIPPEKDAHIQALWSGYTSRDANYLIHPDHLADNKAPLHMALKAAQALEQEEDMLGYTLRTHAIATTLNAENARFAEEHAYEQKFFRFIFGSTLAGDFGKVPRIAHFDYQQAFNETMQQTFIRLQAELESGQEGKAIAFLNAIYPHYEHHITGLWVRSLLTSAQRSADIDVFSIIKNLQVTSYPWQENLTQVLDDIPSRNVLSETEIETIAETLPYIDPKTTEAQTVINDIATITEGEDMYSFQEKSRTPASGHQFTLTVDLDTVAEDITATLTLSKGGKTRIVPFRLSFAGDKESFMIDTIGDVAIAEEAIEQYRGLVNHAIARRAQIIREQTAKQQKELNFTPVTSSEFTITTLTRTERLALYQEQKESKKRRRKPPQEVPVFPDPAQELVAAQKPPLIVHGMDNDSIQDMLKEGRIKSVDAQTISDKLQHIVDATGINKKMLGKRIDTNAVSDNDTSSINLRQINLTFDGGHTPIRVYVQDMGGGEFAIRGILHKKGNKDQTRYIRGLVKTLVEEQQSNKKASN